MLCCLSVRVSVSELQSHAELDPDADGTLSETEAQVLNHTVKIKHTLDIKPRFVTRLMFTDLFYSGTHGRRRPVGHISI